MGLRHGRQRQSVGRLTTQMRGAGEMGLYYLRRKTLQMTAQSATREYIPITVTTHAHAFDIGVTRERWECHAANVADREQLMAARGEREGHVDEESFGATEASGQHDLRDTHSGGT